MSQTTPPPVLTTLPGEPVPYVVTRGGGRAHLLIDQVGRCLAGAEETGGAMAMMALEGPAGRPIPLHYHVREHEFFYCHRGTMQLWLDGESRILHAGDFGYAAPGTVHAYGLLSHHAGFVGPITPGGWERFFDLTGIPYDGVAPFPVGFRPEIPFEKFGQAERDFDMKYLPETEYTAARSDAADDHLPGSQTSYFLRAGEGPRHLIGGALHTSLITSAETGGSLMMATLQLPRGAGVPTHAHERTTEGILVLEGALRVWLDGVEHELHGGDYASIPAGTAHRWVGAGFFTRTLSITTPGGLEAVPVRAGEPTELRMVGREPPVPLSAESLRAAGDGVDLTVEA
jgi:quercetin 2,3-dioxygenase